MISSDFDIKRLDFNNALFNELEGWKFAEENWPLIYILSDGNVKEAYIGETIDTISRMASHLKHSKKSKLKTVHLITSTKFNKSATLDIESNLIKYFSADGQYKLLNANIGLANHTYYQKDEIYKGVFSSLWDNLRSEGIVKHSLEHINNSDLFKYSPYKNLTKEQIEGLLAIINNLLEDNFRDIIIEGGAGTGKTILATFLFKLLNTDNEDFNFKEFGDEEDIFVSKIKELKQKYPKPKMALVIPMSSFRETLKKVFRNIKGLSSKMVVGPAEITKDKEKFDILVVDESHRLRRRKNLGAYFGSFDNACSRLDLDKHTCSELDWVVLQSKKSILFYDENQSIKPSDTLKFDFDKLKANIKTNIMKLKSQFRVMGGNDYVEYIDNLLHCNLNDLSEDFKSKKYDFKLFNSLAKMVSEINLKNNDYGLSRLVAGYSWPWISKNDNTKKDICIEGVELQWNSTNKDWIYSDNSINEVGCIHTTQGYDLNYTGVIFGNEISYNKVKDEIVINEEEYFDRNGKQSIKDPQVLKEYIINIYKTIMLRGIRGTYVYVCDDNLREYFRKHIQIFEEEKQVLNKIIINDNQFENSVPFYDIQVAAGNFSVEKNIEQIKWLLLPDDVRYNTDLFSCKVVGESMNKVIPNGSYCLFSKYYGGSRNGQIVLVEHSSIQDPDFGSGYTIKEYSSSKINITSDDWRHASIQLKPLSFDSSFKNIVLFEDELNSFKVLGKFIKVIY
jgi:DUF2075 family protein/predicted GIY-YIG superfamily endonuclease